MSEPLAIVGVGSDGTVVAVRVLRPSRIVTMTRSRWMIELPIDHPVPAVGDQISPYVG